MTVYIKIKEHAMNYNIGTPCDRNPARIVLLVRRNRKPSRLENFFTAGLYSTMMFGVVLAAMQIM